MSEMPQRLFRTKICGVTTVDDVLAAVAAGVDAIGLNFVASSPRFVEPSKARELVVAASGRVQFVGVFVNQHLQQIERTVGAVGLDVVQLHGDEPLTLLEQLHPLPVIRAVRCRDSSLEQVQEVLAEIESLSHPPLAVLLDAYTPDAYGGTGKALDWKAVAEQLEDCTLPLILAGGLNADNVELAIETARPDAVDTASGVETSPGRKSSTLMSRFVAAAHASLQSLHSGD